MPKQVRRTQALRLVNPLCPPPPWQKVTPAKAMPEAQGPIYARGTARRVLYGKQIGVERYPWMKQYMTSATRTLMSIHPNVVLGPIFCEASQAQMRRLTALAIQQGQKH